MNERLNRLSPAKSVIIADKARKLKAEGHDIALLQTGDPGFDTPEYIQQAAAQAMADGQTHYCTSTGLPLLKEVIVANYLSRFGVKVPIDSVFIGNGAVQLIYAILHTLLSPDDEVLIPLPAWPQYANIVSLAGGRPRMVDCTVETMAVELEALVTPQTKAILLNSPVNPTGCVVPESQRQALLEIAERNDIYILCDEVYNRIHYLHDSPSMLASGDVLDSDYFVYINSFSKYHCMTGWRVGYAFIPADLRLGVTVFIQHTTTCSNPFSQHGAIAAMRDESDHQPFFDAMLDTYAARRAALIEGFAAKGIDYYNPDGAFYMFVACAGDAETFCQHLLSEHGIAVVPGTAYGSPFSGYYRISYSVQEAHLQRYLQWINDHGS